MVEVLKAFVVGIIFGGVTTLLKLPLPAPPVFAGLMGIVGVFVGYQIVSYFSR